jgi:hypothetical protein
MAGGANTTTSPGQNTYSVSSGSGADGQHVMILLTGNSTLHCRAQDHSAETVSDHHQHQRAELGHQQNFGVFIHFGMGTMANHAVGSPNTQRPRSTWV